MPIIIDGYNLLHASGILGAGRGPGYFERSRTALLNFLAEALPAAELEQTTVVFDAAGAPPGLASTFTHRGVTVHFARDRASADERIAELIRASHHPRKLTVVSSDHAVQRAARRRRATAIDSDEWMAQARQARAPQRGSLPASAQAAGEVALPQEEVAYWLNAFGIPSEPESEAAAAATATTDRSTAPPPVKTDSPTAPPAAAESSQPQPSSKRRAGGRQRRAAGQPAKDREILSKRPGEAVFPPGYADDVSDST